MQFLKELLISATSGLFGRLLLVLIGAGGGLTIGAVVISGSNTTTSIMLLTTFNFAVVCSMVGFFRNLHVLKEWSQEHRQDEIRRLELEREILELEIQRGNQQSLPDDDSSS